MCVPLHYTEVYWYVANTSKQVEVSESPKAGIHRQHGGQGSIVRSDQTQPGTGLFLTVKNIKWRFRQGR